MLAFSCLIAIFAVAWFWLDTAAARDRARRGAHRLCSELGVQFLDQTVALSRTRLRRGPNGGLCWERLFRFEFSESGIERYSGRVEILGRRATWAILDGARIGRVLADVDQLGNL